MARNAISSGKELISPYKIIAAKTDSLQQFYFPEEHELRDVFDSMSVRRHRDKS